MFRSEQAYVEFEKVIARLEGWIGGRVPGVLCYSRASVENRLVQCIVELGLVPFVRECARCEERGSPFPGVGAAARFQEFSVEMQSGRLSVSWSLTLRAIAEFVIHWTHAMGAMVAALVWRVDRKGPATILLGVGRESLQVEGSDARFVEFCRDGPIIPLTAARRIIVQSTCQIPSVDPGRFEYTRFPLFFLLRQNPPNLSRFFSLLLSQVHAAAAYCAGVVRFRGLSLLGRDLAYHALVKHLNDEMLVENVVITNSNYTAQPLWMHALLGRHYRTHMVWYSQNAMPLVYSDHPLRVDTPNLRHLRVEESWVWTEPFAQYLKQLAIPGQIHVVGPILWHLPRVPCAGVGQATDIVITLFDVTPYKDSILSTLGLLGNYYSTRNMVQFLKESVEVGKELEKQKGRRVRVLLKHKRGHSRKNHDERYIALVADLAARGELELVPHDCNMYELLGQTDVAIVIPYSSPAYVANSLGVKSLYFDPSKTLVPTFQPAEHVGFSSGYHDLLRMLQDAVDSQSISIRNSSTQRSREYV